MSKTLAECEEKISKVAKLLLNLKKKYAYKSYFIFQIKKNV